MGKKAFFTNRTLAQTAKLERTRVYTPDHLISTLLHINPAEQAVEARYMILPGKLGFDQRTTNRHRKTIKHGFYVPIAQAETRAEAQRSQQSPIEIILQSLNTLSGPERPLTPIVGYEWAPIQGRDKVRRMVPLVNLFRAARQYAYSSLTSSEMDIKPYSEAIIVTTEGAEITVKVPSSLKKQKKHEVKLSHVPVEDSKFKNTIIWSLTSSYVGDAAKDSLFDIAFNYASSNKSSEAHRFYPREIAAYWAIASQYFGHGNKAPFEMNPFPFPTDQAVNLYVRLLNNVLVYDPQIDSKDHLRQLSVAEQSIILCQKGIRDGFHKLIAPKPSKKLKEYNFQAA